jgi:hypothetical protein
MDSSALPPRTRLLGEYTKLVAHIVVIFVSSALYISALITCLPSPSFTLRPDPSLAVVGGHAVSATADIMGEWDYSYFGGAAYGMQVKWQTASHNSTRYDCTGLILRRERPKILFGEDGQPEWLLNGVGLALADGTLGPGSRNTFTFAQQIVR